MPDRSTLVVELTQELARISPQEPFPLRLCRAFTSFANADGGAISLGFTTSERTLICVTDDLVSLFEDVQDALREGPTLDAFRTGRPVVCASWEEQARRWPVLMESMPPTVSSTLVYAFPMLPEQTLVGVVSLHVRPSRALARTAGDLDFLADVLGAAIVGGVPVEDGGHVLWAERDRISQATGMIVAQLGLDPADALAVLRAHAFALEASVAEVSQAVLVRELVFTDLATELEILQMQRSNGPCVDVIDSNEALSVSGVDHLADRWQEVGQAIGDAGFESVEAFPLRWRGTALGGLNVFRSAAPTDPQDAEIGQAFADIATLAVISSMPLSTEQAAARLHEALSARELVEQAKGVIAYVENIDMGAAYDVLLRRAEMSGETLTRTAAAVIEDQQRHLRPS